MKGFGILRPQFKDLADFDAADDVNRCAAVRAGVAFDHGADGRNGNVLEITGRVDVLIVIARLIGPGNAVRNGHSRRIDEDEEGFIIGFVGIDRTHIARLEA